MEQTAIFYPMFTTIFLTIAVWLFMFAKRIPWIQANDFTPEQFRPHNFLPLMPPDVAAPSDNLKNLFEIPVLFYAIVLYLHATNSVDSTYVTAAWVFAGFRVLHSVMHCTVNHVPGRFMLYLVSSIAVFFMAIRAGLALMAG